MVVGVTVADGGEGEKGAEIGRPRRIGDDIDVLGAPAEGNGMARFYFNIRGGEAEVRDDFGRNLPDLESARREAVQVARIITSVEVMDGGIPLHEWVDVQDAERRPVFAFPFRAALRL